MRTQARALVAEPLFWAALGFALMVLAMPASKPVFAALFPELDRPFYEQDSFFGLVLAHLGIVAASSIAATAVALSAGIFVTRPAGVEFRAMTESIVALGQTFPPVAVLALAVPLTGFGTTPALIALTLYGLLPILQNTLAGLASVPGEVRDAGRGMGMTGAQILLRLELPLAAPVILAGIRTSVVINVGTATIASTVGARTLGLPIIVGLNGSNLAYVLQGAALVGLLGVLLDLAFARGLRGLRQWRPPA